MSNESERLLGIIESGAVIEYYTQPDKEHPEILWTVFGATRTEEVIVRAKVADQSFLISSPSRLAVPPMCDRIFGIDFNDEQLARQLSDQMWAQIGPTLQKLAAGSAAGSE